METLAPLETYYEGALKESSNIGLPPALETLYGHLRFPAHDGRPYVFGNFVTTLDGVVSLAIPGKAGGGPISGDNQHDRMVMGLLRAVSDAVIVAAGTVRAVSKNHIWTADYIYPPLTQAYKDLRERLGRSGPPLQVVVTGRGDIDLSLRVFGGDAPVLIVTTEEGARRLRTMTLPSWVTVAIGDNGPRLSAASVLGALARAKRCDLVLCEGGSHLIGDFFAEKLLDELFLTLAPQIAGQDDATKRPSLVMGHALAPGNPAWGDLVSLKRGGSHLFLRYKFPT